MFIPTDDILLDKFVGRQGAPPLCKDVIDVDVTKSWIFQIWMDVPFQFFQLQVQDGKYLLYAIPSISLGQHDHPASNLTAAVHLSTDATSVHGIYTASAIKGVSEDGHPLAVLPVAGSVGDVPFICHPVTIPEREDGHPASPSTAAVCISKDASSVYERCTASAIAVVSEDVRTAALLPNAALTEEVPVICHPVAIPEVQHVFPANPPAATVRLSTYAMSVGGTSTASAIAVVSEDGCPIAILPVAYTNAMSVNGTSTSNATAEDVTGPPAPMSDKENNRPAISIIAATPQAVLCPLVTIHAPNVANIILPNPSEYARSAVNRMSLDPSAIDTNNDIMDFESAVTTTIDGDQIMQQPPTQK